MNLTSDKKNSDAPEIAPKTALITGAAKRVGREIALALAADGWNIALHHNSTDISEVAEQCQKLGVKTCTIKADLNNLDELHTILPAANSQLGEITLLVNNASIFEKFSFAETTEDIFNRHMDINFKAPFFLSQDFTKQTQNGQIINISDTNITKNKSTYFVYLLSKKALSNLSDMLTLCLAPNIRVNSILPTTVSEFSENVDQVYLQKRISELPMKNITTIAEIISALRFLISSNLTGQKIFTDGGEQIL